LNVNVVSAQVVPVGKLVREHLMGKSSGLPETSLKARLRLNQLLSMIFIVTVLSVTDPPLLVYILNTGGPVTGVLFAL
jgi:hypothetical protein